MFKDKLIDRALGAADLPITIDRSRCMRMRFDQNNCPVCISNCHSGAITVNDEIVIDAKKCTLCMVCVSECPTDCFDIKEGDFFSILSQLRKSQNSIPYPVLGCRMVAEAEAHERTVCLGSLSDEHLIAINAFMDKPLQLNLTSCAGCNNSFVADTLKARVEDIRETTGIDVAEKAVLIERRTDLKFEEINYDRRGFFSAVKNMAFIGASGLFEDNSGIAVQAYSQKKLPVKRTILNAVLRKTADKEFSARILQEYAFSVQVDATCDNCYSCIGMCPTGALKSKRVEPEPGLLFNSSMCNGCALCRDFCFNNAIALLRGYSGEHYFEYETCNKNLCRADTADEVSCHGQ
ncbi:MAG: 4Fe-4S binding protein [Nitrospirae bacterium]|nr:4Fe-4S binding protein [Nitrospirota bacterium]